MAFLSRRRLLLFVAIVAMVAFPIWLVQSRNGAPPDPPTVVTAGIDPEAADAVEAALANVRQHPRTAAAWGDLGLTLFAHEFFVECLPCFAEAEKLDPSNFRWPYFQGMALYGSERLPPLMRAAALADREPALQVRVAEALLEQGRLGEAGECFRRALALDPGHPFALLGMGIVLVRQGQAQAGLQYLTPIAELPTARKTAHTLLAEAYRQMEELKRAAEAEARAQALPPDARWFDPIMEVVRPYQKGLTGRIRQGEWLLSENRPAEAIAFMRETLKRYPNAHQAHVLLWNIYLRMGNFKEAEHAVREIIRIKPDDVEAITRLGMVLYEEQQFSAAANEFRRALQIQSNDATAEYKLGECLLQLGDRPGAVSAWQEALRHRPNSAEVHFSLGNLLVRQGQIEEALRHLEAAAQLEPANQEYRTKWEALRRSKEASAK
jgi:tetratricopeptide (TPR) repeat protein